MIFPRWNNSHLFIFSAFFKYHFKMRCTKLENIFNCSLIILKILEYNVDYRIGISMFIMDVSGCERVQVYGIYSQ